MAKTTKKHTSTTYQHKPVLLTLAAAVLAAVLFLTVAQLVATRSKNTVAIPVLHSKLAYVDGDDATNQVAGFYKQYIDTRSTPAFRTALVKGYGDSNLAFYSQYYQHGFDPITCSTSMPTRIKSALVSTGSVAYVTATEYFSDGSKLTVNTAVVLNDKLAIDSINCPGTMGNLPPASS